MKKQANAYTKIQQAKLDNERDVIEFVRMKNNRGEGYNPNALCQLKWLNAIERLVEKKKLRFRKNYGYVVIN